MSPLRHTYADELAHVRGRRCCYGPSGRCSTDYPCSCPWAVAVGTPGQTASARPFVCGGARAPPAAAAPPRRRLRGSGAAPGFNDATADNQWSVARRHTASCGLAPRPPTSSAGAAVVVYGAIAVLRAPVVASSAGFFEQVCSWAVGFKLRGVEEGIPAEAFDFAAGLEGHFDVKHSSLFRRSMQQSWGCLC